MLVGREEERAAWENLSLQLNNNISFSSPGLTFTNNTPATFSIISPLCARTPKRL